MSLPHNPIDRISRSRAQLSLPEPVRGNFRTQRQRRERQNVGDGGGFELAKRPACHMRDRGPGIGRKGCRNHPGFGDAELAIGRLQSAIVEQRDLDRGFRSQRSFEQANDL